MIYKKILTSFLYDITYIILKMNNLNELIYYNFKID